MALDHARHERRPGQVDDLGAGGRGDVRTDCGDLVPFDQHRPAFVRLRVDAVEHARRAEEESVGQGRSGGEDGGEEQDQAAHGEEPMPKTAAAPSGRKLPKLAPTTRARESAPKRTKRNDPARARGTRMFAVTA